MVLAAVAVVGLLAAFSRVILRIEYRRQEMSDWLLFEVSAFWGLLRYRIVEPDPGIRIDDGTLKLELEVETAEAPRLEHKYSVRLFPMLYRVWRLWQMLRRYRQVLVYAWHRLRVTRFEWHISLGTGNPATTGVACGIVWSVADFLLGWFSPRLKAPASVSVSPDFFRPLFRTSFNLTASLELRHLFGAGLSFLHSRVK